MLLLHARIRHREVNGKDDFLGRSPLSDGFATLKVICKLKPRIYSPPKKIEYGAYGDLIPKGPRIQIIGFRAQLL